MPNISPILTQALRLGQFEPQNSPVVVDVPRTRGTCALEGCDRPTVVRNPDRCNVHYQRELHAGDRPARSRTRGKASGPWKGDNIGFAAAHARKVAQAGPAKLHTCQGCEAARAHDWALQPDTPPARILWRNGQAYSPDPADYSPMCQSCHAPLDRWWRAARAAARVSPDDLLPGLGSPDLVVFPESVHGPLVPWAGDDA